MINEYKFVYEEPDNGWWLKIDSVDKLIDYHQKTEKFYGDVLKDYLHNKEGHYTNQRTYAVIMYAERHNLTIIDAIIQFRLMIAQQQLDRIYEDGAIYINSAGGYHSNATYNQYVIKDKLIFPDFKSNDIKISQFPGGEHFYAYVGNMQIINGDIRKWDTYEEAYKYAKKYVSDSTEEKHEVF